MLDNLELPNETIDKVYDDASSLLCIGSRQNNRFASRSINAALVFEIWTLKRNTM